MFTESRGGKRQRNGKCVCECARSGLLLLLLLLQLLCWFVSVIFILNGIELRATFSQITNSVETNA